MIYYKQIKCQDNALKIHVEDRSQLLTQTDGSEEQQMTSLSGGGGQQKLLHVPEAHWDGITDLISLWPDLLISSDVKVLLNFGKFAEVLSVEMFRSWCYDLVSTFGSKSCKIFIWNLLLSSYISLLKCSFEFWKISVPHVSV
uniref:Uncharacterized protein n=1 Tax=Meloidogyne enterolobii TaxID=390850 RepID=A0A6V7VIB5_MELEN|nr:unnamed protein product [Meloidogyne enterolobii]